LLWSLRAYSTRREILCRPSPGDDLPPASTQIDSAELGARPAVSFLHKLAAGTLTVPPDTVSQPRTTTWTDGNVDTDVPLSDALPAGPVSLKAFDSLPRSCSSHHPQPGPLPPALVPSSDGFGPFQSRTRRLVDPDAHRLSLRGATGPLAEAVASAKGSIHCSTQPCSWGGGAAETPGPADDRHKQEIPNEAHSGELHVRAGDIHMSITSNTMTTGTAACTSQAGPMGPLSEASSLGVKAHTSPSVSGVCGHPSDKDGARPDRQSSDTISTRGEHHEHSQSLQSGVCGCRLLQEGTTLRRTSGGCKEMASLLMAAPDSCRVSDGLSAARPCLQASNCGAVTDSSWPCGLDMGTAPLQAPAECGRSADIGDKPTNWTSPQIPPDQDARPCCEGRRQSFSSLHARMSSCLDRPPLGLHVCLSEVLGHIALGMRAYSSRFSFPRRCTVLQVLDKVTAAVQSLAQYAAQQGQGAGKTPPFVTPPSVTAQAGAVSTNFGSLRHSPWDALEDQGLVRSARTHSTVSQADQVDPSKSESWAAVQAAFLMAWHAVQQAWDAVCEGVLTCLPGFVCHALKEASAGHAVVLSVMGCTHTPAIMQTEMDWLHVPLGFGHHGLMLLNRALAGSQLVALRPRGLGQAVERIPPNKDPENVGQHNVRQAADTAHIGAGQSGSGQRRVKAGHTAYAKGEKPCKRTLKALKTQRVSRCPVPLHCAWTWDDFDDRVELRVDWTCAPKSHALVSKTLQAFTHCRSTANIRSHSGCGGSTEQCSKARHSHLVVFVHGFAGLSTDLRVLCNHVREAVPGVRTLCSRSLEVRRTLPLAALATWQV
jgi:hypothetical protein